MIKVAGFDFRILLRGAWMGGGGGGERKSDIYNSVKTLGGKIEI